MHPTQEASSGASQAPPLRTIFRSRRPLSLVVPLAGLTETAGILCLVLGASIGWFIVAAPPLTLLLTGAVVRPSLQLTRRGIVQRQYPFSTTTPWDSIEEVTLVHVRGREILAYRLRPDAPPPRRQPVALLLKAEQVPFDGGYFVDALDADPNVVRRNAQACLTDVTRREGLPT